MPPRACGPCRHQALWVASRRARGVPPFPLPAYLRKLYSQIGDTFWLLPGVMTFLGVLLAVGLVALDRSNVLPAALLDNAWVYNGGGTGARTLLGAVVSSTIGVAGTVFSITIAALSLAAGQMGPRLLRNFTHDRGVQFTLGTFLGTFSYALMVLRSVRTQDEGAFTPHFSLTISIVLAFVCVATLIYFVGHMAGRINVDTVVDLVSDDLRSAVRRLTVDAPQPAPPADTFWRTAKRLVDDRRGYLQEPRRRRARHLGAGTPMHDPSSRAAGRLRLSGCTVRRCAGSGRRRRNGHPAGDGPGGGPGQFVGPGVRGPPARRSRRQGTVARHQRSPYRDQCPRPTGRIALRRGPGPPRPRAKSSTVACGFSLRSEDGSVRSNA